MEECNSTPAYEHVIRYLDVHIPPFFPPFPRGSFSSFESGECWRIPFQVNLLSIILERLVLVRMTIKADRLLQALSTIHESSGGYIREGDFISLMMNIRLNALLRRKVPNILSFLRYIDNETNKIEVVTSRLAWQKELWSLNKLDDNTWMSYASCDIDFFHIIIRSIFDYLAKIMKRVANQPEQVPDEGFNDLKNWLIKEGIPDNDNLQRVGKELANIVLSCEWFDDIKNIRDLNIHQGGFTITFPEKSKNRILFQVYKGVTGHISIPEVMYNENVVDFELYAAVYFGYLSALLEVASKIIDERIDMHRYPESKPHKAYRHLPPIYRWMSRLV